jgi:DNA polymerase-4
VVVCTGVVASRSYEAKARGVQTGMPLAEARRRCPELVVCAGDARAVERYRHKVAEILRRFAPVVEVCSLDDFYADLTGVPLRVRRVLDDATATADEVSLRELCERVRATVRQETGLSVAQGLGTTRTVARMATTRAKPGGICEVMPGDETTFLATFPVEAVPGIGPRTAEWLRQVGVTTVAQLREVDRELLRQSFGARGDELWLKCRGLDDAPVRASPVVQSISRESSFEPRHDVDSQQRPFLRGMLSYLLDRATAELRRQRLLARTVEVRVRHVDGAQGEKSRSLRDATDRTDLLMAPAGDLLDDLLERRVLVRLVGVTLRTLVGVGAAQGLLFGGDEQAKKKLFAAVDAVRERHGFGALVVGESAELLGKLPQGRHGFVLRTPSLAK